MEPEALDFLVSSAGQRLLRQLAAEEVTEESFLGHLTRLRRAYSRDQATAVLDLVMLRRRAAAKFSQASQMYFTREALEQASGEAISAYRAERFAAFSSVADLGCGIGGDTIGLAQHSSVTAVEHNLLRLRMCELNTAACGVRDRVDFVHADVTEMQLPPSEACFLDPSRRAGGRRIWSVFDYEPPLTILHRILAHTENTAAKISPGVSYGELDSMDLSFELEFISEGRTCKEGVMWFGGLRSGCSRRATILPDGASITDSVKADGIAVECPQAYLYEPRGAVIRAQLVEHLASMEGLSRIDDSIAYLTSDRVVRTPFARAIAVEEVHPFNLKRLNERLRALGVGYVTIMKRGSPIDPDSFRRRLKLQGKEGKVLVLTKVRGEPTMVIGHDVQPRERYEGSGAGSTESAPATG